MALFPFGGPSPFDMLGDDQHFGGIMQHFNSMMDPFSMFGHHGSMFPSPFAMANPMSMFRPPDMRNKDFSTCYSSSTVMTMSSGPDGRPQIYQASQSTRTAPGGIKETKKSVCDSRTGTKRMAIGHHIGDRGHVRERIQNYNSGEREETEDFINLEEDEAEEFNNEWTRKTRDIRYLQEPRHRSSLPALPAARYRPRTTTSSRRPYPALTYSSHADEEEEEDDVNESDDDDESVNVVADPEPEPEIVVENPRKRPREDNSTTDETKIHKKRSHSKSAH